MGLTPNEYFESRIQLGGGAAGRFTNHDVSSFPFNQRDDARAALAVPAQRVHFPMRDA